jgi:hypothetical protein
MPEGHIVENPYKFTMKTGFFLLFSKAGNI